MFRIKLSNIPRKSRGRVAENIVAIKIYEFKMGVELRHKCKECGYENMSEYADIFAYKPFLKNPFQISVQVNSISLKKHGYVIGIDDSQLKKFKGYYITLFEHEPDDIFLYIESDEMRELMSKRGKMTPGIARHHKDYWELSVPRSLEGFEQYQNPERFIKAVLKDPYKSGNEDTKA